MHQSRGWGLSRYVTLCVVLALHLAFLAALMLTSRIPGVHSAENDPVALVYLPPASFPKIRAENARPTRIKGDRVTPMEPLLLGSTGAEQAPAAAASDGSGSGVDWKAEARRAVQAFEIRNHAPESTNSLSGSPAEDWWWPRSRHNAGDQYKTANGDWVVWINSSCYQIAVAGGSAFAPGAMLPQTVCPGAPGAPRGEPAAKSAEAKKPHSQQ
jgi:hypothetical protein